MVNLARKFTPILWKNVVIRKHHWFMSILELLVPLALFYLVVYIHKHVNQLPLDKTMDMSEIHLPKTQKEILELSFIHHDVLYVAYTPVTNFTTTIINNVLATINQVAQPRPYYLKTGGKVNVTACATEADLEQHFATVFANTTENNYMGYGIVFTNLDQNDFRYKLRSTLPDWKTDNLFDPLSKNLGSQADRYLYQGFIAMQLTVDQAFMKAVTNTMPSAQVVLQQFPDPSSSFGEAIIDLYKLILPLFTMISFILIVPTLLKKIVEEKQTGITELMKMVGLEPWMVWTGWMAHSIMVYYFTCVIITCFLCMDWNGGGAVISYTHWSLVFIMFLLFCVASVSFMFAISSFFYKPNVAMSCGFIIWMMSYFALSYVANTSVIIQSLISLIPTMAVKNGLLVVLIFEKTRVKLTWTSLFYDGLGGNGMSLGLIFGLLILQTILYILIAWYVSAIFPGPYGLAKPWTFIFQWMTKQHIEERPSLKDDENEKNNFEPIPKTSKVGMSIHNLRKVFYPNVVAVDKVNLQMNEGEITALLGHNGAGKTTTMSILTGMFSPTSGSVFVDNYNIFQNMDKFRNSLGLCPQHNLLFSYLTVIEHLIFFGMLKGLSYGEAKADGLQQLLRLQMSNKKNEMVAKLSGGMKRKLSLAIALIGRPKVLMLDEPTSGMDPESRRELWDILLETRHGRTILITTHFMEEADVLGDRIAIMDHGRVRCYGTTIFLKKLYGTGYQLTVLKDKRSDEDAITSIIKTYVPLTELKSNYNNQMVFSLPQENAEIFPNLFKKLEEDKEKYKIKSIGIACTTMEEVFLKVGEITKEERNVESEIMPPYESTLLRNGSNEALTYKKVKGVGLLIQQISALIHKKALYARRKWIVSLVYAILPLLMLFWTMRIDVLDLVTPESEPPLELRLSDYDYVSPDTYVIQNANQSKLAGIFKNLVQKEGSNVESLYNTNVINVLLNESTSNIEHYEKQMIIAGEFNATTVLGLFSGIPLHVTPIVTNLISQTLLQSNPATSSSKITITNHPLNIYSTSKCKFDESESPGGLSLPTITLTILWLSLIPQGLLFLISDFIAFPLVERVNNAKQIQMMTGVPYTIYWLSCLVWDYFTYIVVTIVMALVILFTDKVGMFAHSGPVGMFVLIVLLFGVSGISCAYLFSYAAKTSPSASALFFTFNIIFGLIASIIMYFLLFYADSVANLPNPFIPSGVIYFINNILCLNPVYALMGALSRYATITFNNYMCDVCQDQFPCLKKPYFSFKRENSALGQYLIYLAFDWILYYALILLIDFGYMSIIWHRAKVLWIGKDYDRILEEDSDVRDERDRVDASRNVNAGGDASIDAVLVANGLVKKFSRSFAAVKGVSFQVVPGECFGLLGVNGAGKTTTFRMLTGDEIPTAGKASIFNYTLADNRTKYLKQIGYCPQFDGINEMLTGEEMLRLFALLRGIPTYKVKQQVDSWIHFLGLNEYRNRPCVGYSGGNKRKLCTAIALIGDPPVVFLDEPTSGVDPVSRRNLWDVLARCQKSGQAIVLTSHSMEECEALCTRLTIMVKGRMQCIGSTQYIKQRYGQGYTIMIKLLSVTDDVSIPSLKQQIQNEFYDRCVLKDEHKGLLHYHVTDVTIPLSHLFNVMEGLKKKNKIVEDYTVGDTTLEQVFIAFAKKSYNEG